ncbi:TPA: hypothetical protein QDZ34_004370 [Stenotrophomonas maltophilia]|nr:hypothetical protein [Stenotrophomonas maltophilia]HDS0951807.1 hypothetical protein [Stenotrophomonas maltophilia]HDS1025832.1 hypothetical protein [Stenotrophomonas maltophilia]HDS1028201.1 hypothetical protein [Stenotrophomonas maltophilia]HDS1029977.1 hypothetical protein [Stenotrophomonas maltophilia]
MKIVIPMVLLVVALAGCARPAPTPARTDTPPAAPVVGGDRDAHGCIGSAGYQWCQRSQRCERPWELAQAQGLANTAEAIDAWCAAPATPARK